MAVLLLFCTVHHCITGLTPSDAGLEDGILPITSKIQIRVTLFFNMRNASHVETVFDQHKDMHTHLISISALPGALEDLGIRLTAEEVSVLFDTSDADENGGLDLQDFMRAIKYPGKVEQWADSLPLSRLLAHCLSFKEGDDPLREVSRLSSDELRASANAYGESVQTILADALGELKKCFAEMDRMAASEASSKFQIFRMSSGSVEDFHSGLHGRVGENSAPAIDSSQLVCAAPLRHACAAGDPHPNLSKGMEEEHCVKACCDDEFVSSNYGVRTTPRKEFEIATGRRACPPEDMLDKKGLKVRDVRPIQELKGLKLAQKAGLTEDEIVAVVRPHPMLALFFCSLRVFFVAHCRRFAVLTEAACEQVLYTGPMFQVLRHSVSPLSSRPLAFLAAMIALPSSSATPYISLVPALLAACRPLRAATPSRAVTRRPRRAGVQRDPAAAPRGRVRPVPRGGQPVRDDDPHPRVGRHQDRAGHAAAVGAGALQGARGAHGAARLLLPRRRQRLPRLRRVGLPQHHLGQGRRRRGPPAPRAPGRRHAPRTLVVQSVQSSRVGTGPGLTRAGPFRSAYPAQPPTLMPFCAGAAGRTAR